MATPPVIYVDIIEDKPDSQAEFKIKHLPKMPGGKAYQQYLDHFQPFRVLVKSGDNEEPLFRSTERYFNNADAIHAIELAFGTSSNVYLRQHETGNQLLRPATQEGAA